MAAVDIAAEIADRPHLGEVVEREQLGAQAVVDVVGIIGDVVGDRRKLRLGAGEAPQLQVLARDVSPDGVRHAAVAIMSDGVAGAVGRAARCA